MTKKMKQTVSLFCIAFLITSLVGCSKNSDKERTEIYHLTEVKKLEVNTNANDIILRTTESNGLLFPANSYHILSFLPACNPS